jgi:magnesium-transporting ATPase (P-type)
MLVGFSSAKCRDPSRAPLFQTGWFAESLMTQTLIIPIIRTNKIPFLQSRTSWSLTLTTLAIMAVGAWLPLSPLASSLGLASDGTLLADSARRAASLLVPYPSDQGLVSSCYGQQDASSTRSVGAGPRPS